MINESQARSIAEQWLRHQLFAEEDDVVIDEGQTIEEPFGWVYFYNSRGFLETGDFRRQLLGNAPIVVERTTGTVHETGTSKPLEEYLQQLRH